MKRKTKRLLLIIACIVTSGLLLVLILLQSYPVQKALLDRLVQSIEKGNGVSIQLGSWEMDTFRLRFSFHDLAIQRSGAKSSPPFLQIKQLFVQAPLSILWSKEISFKMLRLKGAKLFLLRDARGDWNLPAPSATAFQMPVLVYPPVLIDRLAVTIADLQANWTFALALPELLIQQTSKGVHSLRLRKPGRGNFAYQQSSYPINEMMLQAELSATGIAKLEAQLQTGLNRLHIQGSMRGFSEAELHLKLDGAGDLNSLQPWLPFPIRSAGSVALQAQVDGNAAAPNISYSLKSNQVVLSQPVNTSIQGAMAGKFHGWEMQRHFANGKFAFSAAVPFDPRSMAVPFAGTLEISAQPGQAAGKLSGSSGSAGRAEAMATWDGSALNGKFLLNLDLLRFVDPLTAGGAALKSRFPALASLKGKVDLQGTIRGTPARLIMDAKIVGQDMAFGRIVAMNMSGTLQYENGRIRIPLLSGQWQKTTWRLSGSLPLTAKTQAAFHIQIQQLPLNSIGVGTRQISSMAPFVSLDAALSLQLEPLKIIADFQKLDIFAKELHLLNETPFQIIADSQKVSIHKMNLRDQRTTIAIDGQLPFRAAAVPGRVEVRATLAKEILGEFFPQISFSNDLQLHVIWAGSFAQPLLSAQSDLDQEKPVLSMLPEPINGLKGTIKIERNVLHVVQLGFSWKSGRYFLNGTVPLGFLSTYLGLEPDFFPAPGHSQLQLTADHVSPQDWDFLFPEAMRSQVSGAIGLEIKLQGEGADWRQISGSLAFSQFNLQLGELKLQKKGSCRMLLRQGRVQLEDFVLQTSGGELSCQGNFAIAAPYDLALSGTGALDLSILNLFVPAWEFFGHTQLGLQAAGTLLSPVFSGQIKIQDGGCRHWMPQINISDLQGTIQLAKNALVISEPITGQINGGTLRLETDPQLTVKLRSLYLDYPQGLNSQLGGDLRLEKAAGKYIIRGSIEVSDSFYRENFDTTSQLLQLLRPQMFSLELAGRSEFGKNIFFDIDIDTKNPFQIDNNVAQVLLNADLKLQGTFYRPVLNGRILAKEGGRINFGSHTFYLDRGVMEFMDPYKIAPDLDISAKSKAGDYEIQLVIKGRIDNLQMQLTSNPPLAEESIVALVFTGKTPDSSSASLFSMLGTQGLGFLSTALTGSLQNGVQQLTGFNLFKVDSSLIAARENPGTRITIGQNITAELQLILSQSLSQSQNRTTIINYNPTSKLNIQAFQLDNNVRGVSQKVEWSWGLKKEAGAEKEQTGKSSRVLRIDFNGATGFPGTTIQKRLRLKPGKRYSFFAMQKDLKRLQSFYQRQDYLEARIEVAQRETSQGVIIQYSITPGLPIRFTFSGAGISARIKRQVRKQWMLGCFLAQRLGDAQKLLQRHMLGKRYYQARVIPQPAQRLGPALNYHFLIQPGLRYQKLQLLFAGNRQIASGQLRRLLTKKKAASEVFVTPEYAVQLLLKFYRERGFVRVAVHRLMISFADKDLSAVIHFPISEGPRFKVGDIAFSGNQQATEQALQKELALKKGDWFIPDNISLGLERIEAWYQNMKYYQVEMNARQQVDVSGKEIALLIEINEHNRKRIGNIRISGNRLTREQVIKKQLTFGAGDILDYKALNETRKRLYDLSIFDRVDICILPVKSMETQPAEEQCDLEIHLKEIQPFRMVTGLSYSSDIHFGLDNQFYWRNFLKRAQSVAVSLQLNKAQQDAKIYYGLPSFFGPRNVSEVFLFADCMKLQGIIQYQYGLTLQQQFRLNPACLLLFSYTREKQKDLVELQPGISQLLGIRLGYVSASITVDKRNNFLNPSRGYFWSESLQYGASFFGSEAAFIASLSQFNFYHSLSPHWISASSIRLGLGKGLGQPLGPGQKFYAGGESTIRGFAFNTVGPHDPLTGRPLGGEGLLIIRQELRYKSSKGIDPVLFFDLGNVYSTVREINPLQIRKVAGIGCLIQIFGFPPIRLDWGFKLDRRLGESASEISFTIGQAF
jgi:outer membrane protein assembly complex protein YaeT